nr:hypothetical protein [Desulfobacterales bacterium]
PDYWRESPNRWRNDQWRQSPVNNRNAPYRWNQQKWRQSPDNWRNKAYRFNKKKWQQSPLNWQNSPYRWGASDGAGERDAGEIDIKMNFDSRAGNDQENRAPQAETEAGESSEESPTPPEDHYTGPHVVEVGKGAQGARGSYSERVLPVIRIHGTAPSAAPQSGRTATKIRTRPKEFDGFSVYGLQP